MNPPAEGVGGRLDAPLTVAAGCGTLFSLAVRVDDELGMRFEVRLFETGLGLAYGLAGTVERSIES